MKIFKLVLLVFLIALTTTTNAQDASNDATWEETINFITKYKEYIVETNHRTINTHLAIKKIEIVDTSIKIYIDSNKDFYIKKINYYPNQLFAEVITLDLKNLKRIDYSSSYGGIQLDLKNNAVNFHNVIESYRNKNNSEPYYSKRKIKNVTYNDIIFYVDDEDLSDRLAKAFEHLTYLAIKKREEDHKASGDKF